MSKGIEAHKRELERVEGMVLEATHQIETEGGDIRLFAFAMLRAGAEMVAYLDGGDAMSVAFSKLLEKQEIRDGRAGRA